VWCFKVPIPAIVHFSRKEQTRNVVETVVLTVCLLNVIMWLWWFIEAEFGLERLM
jgi:hypothetical protein